MRTTFYITLAVLLSPTLLATHQENQVNTDFEYGFYAPTDEPPDDRPSNSPNDPKNLHNSYEHVMKKSFSKHQFDDETWPYKIASIFTLISPANDYFTLPQLMAAFELQPEHLSLLFTPNFQTDNKKITASDIEKFFNNIATDDVVTKEAWTNYWSPSLNDEYPLPKKFNCEDLGQVKAFLFDLDGTIYRPGELISGAKEIYKHIRENNIPCVFVSNTGAKAAEGTQKKLSAAPYKLSEELVPLESILTAAEVQADFMIETIPEDSQVVVIAGGNGFWRQMLEKRGKDKYESWDIIQKLDEDTAKMLACSAAQKKDVYVVFFLDGEVEGQWSYDLLKYCAFILRNGAKFIYTADDPFNPSCDSRYTGIQFPLPGPGMFAAAMRQAIPERLVKDIMICCGKGGNHSNYMMEKAVEMLRQQGFDDTIDTILMVGDRFNTDVRAGFMMGMSTCLVESGCHKINERQYYPTDRPTYYADSLSDFLKTGDEQEANSALKPSHSYDNHLKSMKKEELLIVWVQKNGQNSRNFHRHRKILEHYYNKVAQPSTSFTIEDLVEAICIFNPSEAKFKIKDTCAKILKDNFNKEDISIEQFFEVFEAIYADTWAKS